MVDVRIPPNPALGVEYLQRRWIEGCRNGAQLARELGAQGFDVPYLLVRRYIAGWRGAYPGPGKTTAGPPLVAPVLRTPSSKHVARMLLKNQESLTARERALVGALRQRCPDVQRAAGLAQEFVRMVHRRRPERLERWIARALKSRVPHDLRSFARSLKSDYAALHAALTLNWSNGHVEGQINRVKLIKRQMYGRANFDLLRQRVLYVG